MIERCSVIVFFVVGTFLVTVQPV